MRSDSCHSLRSGRNDEFVAMPLTQTLVDRRVGEWLNAAKPMFEVALSGVLECERLRGNVAVGGVTEKGSAFHDFGLSVAGPVGFLLLCRVKACGTKSEAPLPYVAGDGVEAEGIGWEGVDGAGSGESRLRRCRLWGNSPLPDVTEVLDAAGLAVRRA